LVTPVGEIMRALDDMVRAGKVLYLGISDTPAWIVAYANAIAAQRGWTAFSGLQPEYSLAQRDAERHPGSGARQHLPPARRPPALGRIAVDITNDPWELDHCAYAAGLPDGDGADP
jgi:aryl-alcohol dehydrogenase-like predicted oxidoreductase